MKRLYCTFYVMLIIVLTGHTLAITEASADDKIKDKRPEGQIFWEFGIALTPKNFPNHKGVDVVDMFEKAKDSGSYAALIYQWSETGFDKTAKIMVEQCDRFGLKPIVGLSPTVLEGLRGELDVPGEVRKKAGNDLSFSNPVVWKPFAEAAKKLAKLKPPYLCLATEINMLAYADLAEYVKFAKVYNELYPVIKKISPRTKVFVSFQWEFMTVFDDENPDKVKEHTKLLDIFRPNLDLMAFTSYPQGHFPTVAEIPSDHYSRMFNHIGKDDEVMIMEIGWPAIKEKDNAEQVAFVDRLPKLMKKVKPRFLIWSLLHDVKTTSFGESLSNTGLISSDGTVKPAHASFLKLKKQ